MQAGNGGHGCASILREKFKPLGGPDGGDGGNGGSITLVVDPGVHTLLDFHFRPHVKAENGKGGAGNNRDGANGADLTLRVPDGTVVQTARRRGARRPGRRRHHATSVARGGRGGRGNAALANTRRKAPGFAELGEPGEAAGRRAGAQERRRRRPGRLPLGRQVVADLGAVGGPAEDRRLPVHHARAQPGRGAGRRRLVRRSPMCPG